MIIYILMAMFYYASHCSIPNCQPVWIGLTDIIGEGQFRWVNSHVVEWVDWLPWSGKDVAERHCTVYANGRSAVNGWDNLECEELHSFVCQDKLGTSSYLNIGCNRKTVNT